ncbi:MAG: AMP-binding protein [Fimbriimonadia bacterium]|nr:AMP-binding protein [Fimbriimonadia bacterium]
MIVQSPYPRVEIPEVSLPEFVLGQVEQWGDKPAFIDSLTGRSMTYTQFAQGARRLAAGLAASGFQKGDVFAIYCPNCPEYAVTFHGVALAGGVNTTINPLYTVDELHFQLVDANAKRLLTIPTFLEKALEAVKDTPVETVYVLGEAEGAVPFASLFSSGEEPPKIKVNPKEDLVVIPYSSGTTGMPKGVMLTHHNLISNVVQTLAVEKMAADEVSVGILPFYHIYGMVVIMNMSLYAGSLVVTMPRFELDAFLKVIQNYKVNRAALVPPIILALAKHPLIDEFDLSSLNYITSGAAPLGADLAAACAKRLNCIVKQGYGLTETSPVTNIMPNADSQSKPGSVGPLVPNTEAKVAHLETGEPLPHGEEGEICIRGPQVMKGYLNNQEATAAMIDSEGWLHTGDIGYCDEQGYFYIVDRAKELIKYKGLQVAPAELEALLLTHPAVADAAVIPSPDEEAGEVPKAFLVLKQEVDPQVILDYIAGHVAPYKKIRLFEIVDQIPKSPSGKILRRLLVQRERERKQI